MPKIFYWMHDSHDPSGGEKHCYEHVDILNASGFDAYALHLTGDRHRWFDNDTRVVRGSTFWDIYDPQRDYLVVPETAGPLIGALPGRRVIFNKNLYTGFRAFPRDTAASLETYTHHHVVAILAVSEHNYEHLRFAFPHAVVKRVYAGIDTGLFRYRDMPQKRKQIAVVAKTADELSILLQILRARAAVGLNRFDEYRVELLKGLSAADAAAMLSDSPLLISLSTHEGLPRTILEGMACGCIVAAWGAGPLKEILPKRYAFEPGDFIGMAKHIESVTTDVPDNLAGWATTIQEGRHTASTFSLERQRAILTEVWHAILERDASDIAPSRLPAASGHHEGPSR